MKINKAVISVICVILSAVVLTVTVSATVKSFYVGSKLVNAELVADSSTTSPVYAAIYSNYYLSMSVSLSASYKLPNGDIKGTGNGGGTIGYTASTPIYLPDGAQWTEITGSYSANDGENSGSTTIIKSFN